MRFATSSGSMFPMLLGRAFEGDIFALSLMKANYLTAQKLVNKKECTSQVNPKTADKRVCGIKNLTKSTLPKGWNLISWSLIRVRAL